MRYTPQVVGLVGILLCSGCNFGEREPGVSLASVAPNGRTRIEIFELSAPLDRDFVLRVCDLQARTTNNVFRSPDEGDVGTERIIWSRDSSRFLLVGRKFYVTDQSHLTNGEQLYLLYDLKSGSLRCNAQQQREYSGFTRAELDEIDWMDKIEPVGAASQSQPGNPQAKRMPPAAGPGR